MTFGKRSMAVGILMLAAGVARAELATHHDGHDTGSPIIPVGSTADGGGSLIAERDFGAPIVVEETTRVGGFVLYTATDPSFEPVEADDPAESVYALDPGTTLRFELVTVDSGVGVKVRGTQLTEPGDAEDFAPAPELHFHPEWQLTLPEGEVACRHLAFKLVATSGAYTDSQTYVVTVTNQTGAHCPHRECGDADGNGAVSVTDGVSVLRAAAGLQTACAVHEIGEACDVDASGSMSVTDGVNVLRAAAGLGATLSCPAHED